MTHIELRGPLLVRFAIWNPDNPGLTVRFKYSAEHFASTREPDFGPEIPIAKEIDSAGTVVFLMWHGSWCHDYATEFLGRQDTSNFTAWRVSCTCAFFDNVSKDLLGAVTFRGAPPPEKPMVFSGSAAYSTMQVIGDPPRIAFSAEKLADGRYRLQASEPGADFGVRNRWRLGACWRCNGVTPHRVSAFEAFLKRIFRSVACQHCLICGDAS